VITFFDIYYALKFIVTEDKNENQLFYEDNSLFGAQNNSSSNCESIPLANPGSCICQE
jgi:hypothetical protein